MDNRENTDSCKNNALKADVSAEKGPFCENNGNTRNNVGRIDSSFLLTREESATATESNKR